MREPITVMPIIPTELATRLNVLQGQIHRELSENYTIRLPLSNTMSGWARELRKIELSLRAIPIKTV